MSDNGDATASAEQVFNQLESSANDGPPDRVLSETVKLHENEVTVEELALDFAATHAEIDQYRKSGLALCQLLKERAEEAEAAGDDELADALGDLSESAQAIHLRISRGDEELLGDREGEYDDFYDDDETDD